MEAMAADMKVIRIGNKLPRGSLGKDLYYSVSRSEPEQTDNGSWRMPFKPLSHAKLV
jgi:hypothetical protein